MQGSHLWRTRMALTLTPTGISIELPSRPAEANYELSSECGNLRMASKLCGNFVPKLKARQPRSLLDRVTRAAPFADLRQIVLLGELFHMHLDGVAVGARRILDFLDGDFAARLRQFQYLPGKRR